MSASIVVMGVSGCGKSTLAAALAEHLRLPLLEGDDHHSSENRDKMRHGVALTDADRDGWLATLADELRAHPAGAVLTCSALRHSYRDRLRAAAPGLRFVFLDITPEAAHARVAARAQHFFNSSLVASQFATLEPPLAEAGVLRVDALADTPQQLAEVLAWLPQEQAA